MRCLLLAVCWLLFVFCSHVAAEAELDNEVGSVAMVWAQQGDVSLEVVYSTWHEGRWSEPLYLTNNRFDDVAPSIVDDAYGNRWVMWVEMSGSKSSSLRYRVYQKDTQAWGSVRTFKTNLGFNSLPVLLRDTHGQLWCLWSGVDGQDDEIFYSRFRGEVAVGLWLSPAR